jgi:undecaprenyl pyrophosphate phosphatase UppP
VSPRITYFSRVLVLLEILFVASIVTLLVAGLRAGPPTGSELSAIACATVVVIVQVVATALRWSVRTPYAVDLRSSRATPAPPLVMVGYSSRLALSTTVTGLMFGATSRAPLTYSLLLALPFLLWSGIKLWRTSTRWADPVERSRVIATVAS